jgi:chromobox protein 1
VATVEKSESGQLMAYIEFRNGRKTKVSMDQVYRHCPRPMLKFYEEHLKFK